jgi:hypothetical protein
MSKMQIRCEPDVIQLSFLSELHGRV